MTDERITAYLLEELSEQESHQFEEQCFAQDEWPAEVDAAEQDLIDAYLRNELTSDRKKRFQERYLTTDARKARVLAAKSFHATLCPSKVTWGQWLQAFFQRPLVPQTAIAILVVAVGVGIYLTRAGRPQSFTPVELAMSSSDRATGVQPKIVSLPLNTDALQVSLKLPEPPPDAAGLRVQFANVNSTFKDLKIESQDAHFVVVNIPAAQVIPGQNLLKLSNKNGVIGNYFFNAEARPR